MEPHFIEQLEKTCISQPDTVALIEAGTGKSITYVTIGDGKMSFKRFCRGR